MKFVQRPHYVAFLSALFLCVAAATLSRTRPSPFAEQTTRQTDDSTLPTNQSLDAVAAELSAIRMETASREDAPGAAELSLWVEPTVDVLTLALAAFGVAAALKTLNQLKRQNDLARRNTIAAVANARAADKNAASAAEQARISAMALATNQEIERAYVSLTHRKVHVMGAQDGYGGWDVTRPTGISVNIEVRNTGRTPGDFLGGYFGYLFGDLPSTPDLLRGRRLLTGAFLLPEKDIDFTLEITTTTDDGLNAGLTGATPMWLVGVVDYRDRFGVCHQGGYARRYSAETHNFVFSPETNSFNYDRPMHPDVHKNYEAG